jgi:hypothetical protein
MLTTVNTVTLIKMVTMVTIGIIPVIALAWNMVSTLATNCGCHLTTFFIHQFITTDLRIFNNSTVRYGVSPVDATPIPNFTLTRLVVLELKYAGNGVTSPGHSAFPHEFPPR